ncbi:ATP-binding cassette domain-containing protein [Deinococcus cellulosilyticus]|uniref:Thiol reductant ABC exporter subunit CydC n=1 Tax=Deinococcus cellulosilyticus (strain DSM 18568 / NBRC 106333 / KACC 11606 / 5516J-15) TaxID=1223518 RepID=A0A511NAE1_DEIC1|nr:ATP-binding cassette domain-containing protein [Deinococcus cellulosilyticus]GEM49331.1 thiol reductant ABC exporter subunit CydC [Deinococcus cellulosilyticus NBRC 106333 = KACC 11606]
MPESRWMPLLAVLCSVLMALFGVGLMTSSGHLLSRAAQHPESILLLMPIVTTVRFFGLGRAALRYAERLTSHEVTLRRVETTRLKVMQGFLDRFTYRLMGDQRQDALESIRKDTETLQNRFLTVDLPALTTWTVTTLTSVILFKLLPAAALLWMAASILILVFVPVLTRRPMMQRTEHLIQLRHARSARYRTQLKHSLELRFLHLPTAQNAAVLDEQIRTVEVQLKHLQTALMLARELVLALTLVAVLFLLVQSALPLAWISGIWLGVVAASEVQVAYLNRIPEQLKVQSIALPDHMPAAASECPSGEVLIFALPTGQKVTVRPGDRILITGPSGIGKSTLFEKLLGFRELESGEALLEGRDLCDAPARENLFAWAPQEPYLLDATAQENLNGWNDRLVKEMGLTDLQPETLLGEAGRHLSGGEMARMQVLRALLRPSPFLLLDEPIAHLDEATARKTIQTLHQEAGERAVVVISHDTGPFGKDWRTVSWTETRGRPSPVAK